MEGAMMYTTRHWVAKPGHEDALAAGLRQLLAAAAPFFITGYVGRDLTRPGYFVTFAVWADRAATVAFGAHPETRRVVDEVIAPHLDPDKGVRVDHMEPIE
jgi:quinol monooxygenase YgiN